MFQPKLQLIPEPDGEFSLLATTLVPNRRYSAGRVIKRAPDGVNVGAHAKAITLVLKYKASGDLGEPRAVHHRAFNLSLSDGDVLSAFVVLPDGQILGTADAAVSERGDALLATELATVTRADFVRPQLTPIFCQNVVVTATGNAGSFTGPAQQLRFLGIVDGKRAANHKIAIGGLMNNAGFQVDLRNVVSGPAIDVAACRDSVFANAR